MPRDDLPIHQLVGFLADFAPERLARLQDEWPDEQALRPGRVLGALSVPMRIRIEVADIALQAMVAQADALSQRVGQRLRRSHRWEFVAQFVALFGSGGVLTAVVGDAGIRFKIASAVLALAGSTVALAVKFARRDLSGTENGLAAQHGELAAAGGSAVEMHARLQPYLRSGDDLDEPAALAALVDEANSLAGRLYALMKRMGERVAPTVFTPVLTAETKAAS
jgi:hypothetical protein